MIFGKGVVVGDAVDPVLDEAGLEVQWEGPRVDLDPRSMGMIDDIRVGVEKSAASVRIGRAIFGYLAYPASA